MSSSATSRRARNAAVVGANEPIPRVSKKLVTNPSASWKGLGRGTGATVTEPLAGGVGIGIPYPPFRSFARRERHRDTAIVDIKQDTLDVSFIALLFLTSLSGLLLLVMRETHAMAGLLRIHLGVVLGLFLTLPYGKFVHGIYRSAALVRSALEASRSQH